MYRSIKDFEYTCNCSNITIRKWEQLMKDAKAGNKKEINRLIKLNYPNMYYDLSLNLYNPYKYFKTKTHIIMVHSGIEYFFKTAV